MSSHAADSEEDKPRAMPSSVPEYYSFLADKFLAKNELRRQRNTLVSSFDPVTALIIRALIVEKIGRVEWNKEAAKYVLFNAFDHLLGMYMFTSEHKRNMVFEENMWVAYQTSSKFFSYMTAMKKPLKVSKESLAILRKLLISDKIDGIVDTKDIIAFGDGAIDMGHFEAGLREGKPEDFVTTGIDYELSAATDPALEEELRVLLEKIFPDKATYNYFLSYMASCLESGNNDKLFVIWYGLGNNGKSVIEMLVEHSFGNYCYKAPTSLFSSRRGSSSGATPEVANLDKHLIAFVQESDSREHVNIGVLKEMTGNDSIYTRALYGMPKTINIRCKFTLVTNKVYNLSQADDATWARIRVIPFIAKFTAKKEEVDEANNVYLMNPLFIKNVKKLAPYFMKLLLAHYPIYRAQGLPACDLVSQYTAELRRNNSPVALFIEDELIRDDKCSLRVSELFIRFTEYSRNNLNVKPLTFANFSAELTKAKLSVVDHQLMYYRFVDY